MAAIRAPALVATVASVVATIGSIVSAVPTAGVVFTAVGTFLMIFVIALLPMPAAVLCQKRFPRLSTLAAITLSLAVGLVMVFVVLWLVETPAVETDGVSTIYRHAGPSLGATKNISYYLYTLLVMLLSLLCFHWITHRSAGANKRLQATRETRAPEA